MKPMATKPRKRSRFFFAYLFIYSTVLVSGLLLISFEPYLAFLLGVGAGYGFAELS